MLIKNLYNTPHISDKLLANSPTRLGQFFHFDIIPLTLVCTTTDKEFSCYSKCLRHGMMSLPSPAQIL